MKRVLFSLLAMFAVGSLWAQGEVTETDLSGFRDVVYAKSITVMQGTEEVNLPIWSKTHAGFVGVSFYVEVPQGATIKYTGSLSDDSYDHTQTINLASWTGNQKDDGYMVIGALASTEHGTDNQLGFYSGDHELGTIVIDVSALEVGTYPIKIKNIEMSKFLDGEANVSITGDEIVSKLIITDRITLDENETEVPAAMMGVDVLVKRTIKADTWSTLCLPFDMTKEQFENVFGTDAKLAYFDEINNTNTVVVEKDGADITNITINFTMDNLSEGFFGSFPYIIKVSKDITEFTVDDVNVASDEANAKAVFTTGNARTGIKTYGFYGTLHSGVQIPVDGLFLSGNQFWYATESTKPLKGFRGYFKFDDVLTDKTKASTMLTFRVDGEVTAIDGINANQRVVEGVYDLQGRKVMVKDGDINNLQRGLYIINGKKVAIK